jgi:uncharacterized protein YecE (DUF72 family)
MSQAKMGAIRVGIGGWTYEPWRKTFYPEKWPQKQELAFASRRLGSIEVNGTYYRSQTPETFAQWRDETPDDFIFSVKAPRFATNRRVLAEAGASIDRFFASGVAELGPKLGAINWQLMPTKKFDPEDFAAFLKLLPKSAEGRPLRHAIEVRHESFRTPGFLALAREAGVAVVVAADSDYPQIGDLTAPFVYARIMGAKKSEKLGYSEAELDLWVERAKIWASGGEPEGFKRIAPLQASGSPRDVYLYFISGEKALNPAAAMELIARLGSL